MFRRLVIVADPTPRRCLGVHECYSLIQGNRAQLKKSGNLCLIDFFFLL